MSKATRYFFSTLILLCFTGLLCSCGIFNAKEIRVSRNSAKESLDYYNISIGRVDELSFESRNFLSSNLLMDDYQFRPVQLVRNLSGMYRKEPSRLTLCVLTDVCFNLALRTDDPDEAVKYDLAAVLYSYQLLFGRNFITQNLDRYDPLTYQAVRTYNSALARFYAYLDSKGLQDNASYCLQTADGRNIIFQKPLYRLPFPRTSYKSFLLCSDFKIENLSHFTHEFGLGVPVIAVTGEKNNYESLKTESPIAHGATVFLRFRRPSGEPDTFHAALEFYDNDKVRSVKVAGEEHIPLIFDYSTPFASYVSTLPDVNLLRYMLNPAGAITAPGLYTLEPYNPDKIPVVLIHGLMSSPHTWMQMVNTLKNDPVIRQNCQFWFFTYSSGNPLLYSASLFRQSILDAQMELAQTPEAKASFNKMVLIGHSMGGLVAKTALLDAQDTLLKKLTGMSWQEIQPKCTPEQQVLLHDMLIFDSIPAVKRVLFLAVPHRGSAMAKYTIAHIGSSLISLPGELVAQAHELVLQLFGKESKADLAVSEIQTGIDALDPDNRVLKLLNETPFKSGVPYHSIIGNEDAANVPGGTDGIVAYSSSHLDGAQSELIVQSGHSVQLHPAAIHEVRRILRLHLQENGR